jgi:hypothetical protein
MESSVEKEKKINKENNCQCKYRCISCDIVSQEKGDCASCGSPTSEICECKKEDFAC